VVVWQELLREALRGAAGRLIYHTRTAVVGVDGPRRQQGPHRRHLVFLIGGSYAEDEKEEGGSKRVSNGPTSCRWRWIGRMGLRARHAWRLWPRQWRAGKRRQRRPAGEVARAAAAMPTLLPGAAKEGAALRLETQLQGLLRVLLALCKGGAANLVQVHMDPWPSSMRGTTQGIHCAG
jgi:hypothetical protein